MATDKPPFKLIHKGGGQLTPHKGGKWQKLTFPQGISDGLESKWPAHPYRKSDATNYLCQLGQSWATNKGIAAQYTNYYLDRLPDGYDVFEIDQPTGPQVYKRLFGHPSGRFYDSIRRFETHFLWLLDGRKGQCECILCGKFKNPMGPPRKRNMLDTVKDVSNPISNHRSKEERRQKSNRPRDLSKGDLDLLLRPEIISGAMTERSRRIARQSTTAHPTDEEGTKHVWKNAIIRLKNAENDNRGIEIDITEEDSIDWMAERDLLKNRLTQIELQHSFIPRRGELVLWVVDLPESLYILRDPKTMAYRLYDFGGEDRIKGFKGTPKWRGGVITDIPSSASKNGNVDFPDILDLPKKSTSLNTAGFRVETMPDPNDDKNKSLSKQYQYIPLRNIRPLSHWQLLLRGIPQKNLHPSILYALTCMTSISLVGKWRFNGAWPAGQIMAKGMYIGSELVTVGDTVRLLPTSSTKCTEVLIVESIRLGLDDILPQHLHNASTTLCSKSVVTLTGQAYTNRVEDAYNYLSNQELNGDKVVPPDPVKEDIVKTIFRPVGTHDYGDWYPLHAPRSRFQVSYDEVLGRLYEADAIRLWSGQRQSKRVENDPMTPDLGFDMPSIIAGRRYATKTDERLPELPADEPNGIRWLISDTRVQALAVATINGHDVGVYHDIRDPATLTSWRAHVRHANGEPISAELLADLQVKKHHTTNNWTEDFVSSTTIVCEKKRGRQPGAKLVNGKVYTTAQLAEMTDAAREKLFAEAKNASSPKNKAIEAEVTAEEIDNVDEIDKLDTIEVQVQPSSPQRYRSRMAGAALISSDEDDSADSRAESRSNNGRSIASHRPSKSKLAAYESASAGEEAAGSESGESDSDSGSGSADLSAWQSKETGTHQSRAPLTKSQIMESVGKGHGNMIANVSEYDDYDDSDLEFDLEEWKNPRNARGGTEESDGGDYRPGESQ